MNSDYTALPFLNFKTSATLMSVFFIIFLAVITVRAIVFKKSLSLHSGKTSVFFSYVACSIVNVMFCTFLYWYWAIILSAVISCVYAFCAAREVKESNEDARMGIYGLNKEIRRIRGELFNDMSPEQQIEYRKTVKEMTFSKPLFIIITLCIPIIAIAIFYFADIGYLFFPILKA